LLNHSFIKKNCSKSNKFVAPAEAGAQSDQHHSKTALRIHTGKPGLD
jgi:hypothetical protein